MPFSLSSLRGAGIMFFLFLLPWNASSQDPIKRKISVFNNSTTTSSPVTGSVKAPVNVIKINPLLYFRGVVPIYYERMISNSTSFEIAPGITFRDEFFEVMQEIDFGDESSLTVNPGFSMNFGFRFYPENSGYAAGIYIAPELSVRNYNIKKKFDLSQPPPFLNRVEKVDVGYSFQEFKFIIGYQDDSYSDVFYIDYYMGVGGRVTNQIDAKIVNDPSGNGAQQVNALRIREFNPAFFLGLKLGVAF